MNQLVCVLIEGNGQMKRNLQLERKQKENNNIKINTMLLAYKVRNSIDIKMDMINNNVDELWKE